MMEPSRHGHGKTPLAGFIFSIVLAMTAISVLSFCIARRSKAFHHLKTLPLARWLILGVYVDSWIFVFSSTVLQSSLGLDSSHNACDVAILLCLVCYLTSKVILYFFLVEKVWIIRGSRQARMKDMLYLFNSLGMLLPYCIVISLTFVFRRADISSGECRIGLRLPANVPLLVFDICINVYLTALFLQPLKQMHSYRGARGKLRTVARRTFIGSACTLFSTVANLTALLVLKGREPGWICFACCNGDVLFSALVLHWLSGKYEQICEYPGTSPIGF
ncbi:hypothetical protein BDZ91DRAFT_188796 [Kalaharituber pfeilii]|nr:hypothetical protein BDZ91DRAFT_188796 [Kalaharituber pfeilii]